MHSVVLVVIAMLLLNFPVVVAAGDQKEKNSPKQAETQGKTDSRNDAPAKTGKTETPVSLKYKPPMLGKPAGRVGGATRGTGETKLVFSALVPEHAGLTGSPQPTLCWFLSKPMNTKLEITINDENSIQPVFEKNLAVPEKPGIHCMKLSEHGVRLMPSLEYQWFIALVPDQEQRSKDIISGGSLVYMPFPDDMSRKARETEGIALIKLFAEGGYWYDALWTSVDLAGKNPGDVNFRAAREQLIGQAGLSDVAHELK